MRLILARGRGRIIPARAGFTTTTSSQPRRSADHPRSRGVYDKPRTPGPGVRGSSPLARGLPRLGWCDLGSAGIIPARAGFTRSAFHSVNRQNGSSPLARGLLMKFACYPYAARIIPARAGFTTFSVLNNGYLRDHPRSRGVYRNPWGSPRLRQWIIPARAGFTIVGAALGPLAEDHPRSRGVYLSGASPTGIPLGSSPLARGLQILRPFIIHSGRIIPARAGFTQAPGENHDRVTDHPRSRGVYWPFPRPRR